MANDALHPDENQRIGLALREEIARRRLSRQQLAEMARISLSSLEKALNGARPFSASLIVRLEQALAISLRPTAPPQLPLAPLSLGGYSHAAVSFLEGAFLTLRPSFEMPGAIFAYRTIIAWEASQAQLVFREEERLDAHYAQSGSVSVSFPSGHIFLSSNNKGEMRLAVLSRPLPDGAFFGLLTTLRADRGPSLIPVSVPFALLPFQPGMALGQIVKEQAAYSVYAEHLRRVHDNGFAQFG